MIRTFSKIMSIINTIVGIMLLVLSIIAFAFEYPNIKNSTIYVLVMALVCFYVGDKPNKGDNE